MIIWVVLDHFWSHVQRRAFCGHEHGGVVGHCPSKPKVTQLDHPISTQQHILWLEVPVYDTVCVEVKERLHQLLGNALNNALWYLAIFFQDLP